MSLFGPIFIRTFLILSVIKVIVLEGKCPQRDHSWCLQIDGFDTVILDGNRFHDIKRVFQQIRVFFNETESKDFDQFFLFNNQAVQQLDENTFLDFTFKTIIIKNCTKLQRIAPEAFNGTQDLVTKVRIELISISGNKNVEDFFESLNSLTKLEELELLHNNIILIPPHSFRQQFLNRLELDGPLDTIDRNAFFGLDNLRILRLKNSIHYIKQHSFDFRTPTNKTLDIYLENHIHSIETGTFTRVLRPITLNLFLHSLEVLEQKVFEPILMSAIRHDLIFHGDLKEMKNKCSLFWLFVNKDKFRGKFSFKTDPSISESDFKNCKFNGNLHQNSQEITNGKSAINSCPYLTFLDKNLIVILSSLYLMFTLFLN